MWKAIPGYEGMYEVSDEGEVRTLEREWVSGMNTRRMVKPGLKKQTKDKDGYPRVTLCLKGKKARKRVHQLVTEAFIGPQPKGMQVRHLDHSCDNNRLDNLCYGTAKENAADRHANPAYVHPRGMAGKKHSASTKKHISETHKRIGTKPPPTPTGEQNPFFGKRHTEETRRKISEARKRRVQ
jgi:hypothetical protein